MRAPKVSITAVVRMSKPIATRTAYYAMSTASLSRPRPEGAGERDRDAAADRPLGHRNGQRQERKDQRGPP